MINPSLGIKVNGTHGMSNNRFYRIRNGMINRCYNSKTVGYKNYGGRGIKVCDRWRDFYNFYNDLYKEYITFCSIKGEKNISIDRYPNNNGNYCKSNIRWATRKEQADNRRKKKYRYKGMLYTRKELMIYLNISSYNVDKILKRKKSMLV